VGRNERSEEGEKAGHLSLSQQNIFTPPILIIGICTKSRDFGTFLSLLDP
jgi:hypothetical protein